MSWVTIIWAMIASACLTLALVHGFVWWWRRDALTHGIFAVAALANAFLAACELAVMRAETTDQFGTALRWGHLAAWLVVVTLVAFIRVYLHAGRLWLAWAIVASRTFVLVLNFAFPPNLNFREITGLRPVLFLGEWVATGEGVRNPWMLVGQFGFLLLMVYAIDAMITVWRRGDGWPVRLLIGTIGVFLVVAPAQGALAL